MSYLEIAKRVKAGFREGHRKDSPGAIDEGRIVAVEICSEILQAHIWLAFDEGFTPTDGQAVFYPDELPFLKDKDAQALRDIHSVKLANPGSRVRQ